MLVYIIPDWDQGMTPSARWKAAVVVLVVVAIAASGYYLGGFHGKATVTRASGMTIIIEEPDYLRRLFVRPGRDSKGLTPQEAVVAFLEDVAAGNREAARSWWHDDRAPRLTVDAPGFDAFFDGLRQHSRITVLETGAGKEGYYHVGLRGGPALYVKKIGDEWKLVRGLTW